MTYLKELFGNDLKRALVISGLAAIMLLLAWVLPALTGETAFAPWLTSGAAVTLMLLYSHVARRVLFPYIDLHVLVTKASTEAMPSAIVVLAVAVVLSTVLITHGMMLR